MNPQLFDVHLRTFLTQLHNLPSLKEILLVRPIACSGNPLGARKNGRRTWRGGNSATGSEETPEEWRTGLTRKLILNPALQMTDLPQYYQVQAHPSGFFGAINQKLEDLYHRTFGAADVFMVQWDGTEKLVRAFIRSQEFADSLRAELDIVQQSMYPGTELPKFTAVYSNWMGADGIWKGDGERHSQEIYDDRAGRVGHAIEQEHGAFVADSFDGF